MILASVKRAVQERANLSLKSLHDDEDEPMVVAGCVVESYLTAQQEKFFSEEIPLEIRSDVIRTRIKLTL
ncbi:hypothetical protein NECAME_10814 [Necator americanus]|uniref:Uncharacterized protein n=1 Tax=Necator americanus TaxID=51031 RepID=W2T853_NECAM|nr:hypothetical protein NECAME_10814 [Necator americanus]ETN77774.1 hypothetical protein NECAME_10814 [Necator americanus]